MLTRLFTIQLMPSDCHCILNMRLWLVFSLLLSVLPFLHCNIETIARVFVCVCMCTLCAFKCKCASVLLHNYPSCVRFGYVKDFFFNSIWLLASVLFWVQNPKSSKSSVLVLFLFSKSFLIFLCRSFRLVAVAHYLPFSILHIARIYNLLKFPIEFTLVYGMEMRYG